MKPNRRRITQAEDNARMHADMIERQLGQLQETITNGPLTSDRCAFAVNSENVRAFLREFSRIGRLS